MKFLMEVKLYDYFSEALVSRLDFDHPIPCRKKNNAFHFIFMSVTNSVVDPRK